MGDDKDDFNLFHSIILKASNNDQLTSKPTNIPHKQNKTKQNQIDRGNKWWIKNQIQSTKNKGKKEKVWLTYITLNQRNLFLIVLWSTYTRWWQEKISLKKKNGKTLEKKHIGTMQFSSPNVFHHHHYYHVRGNYQWEEERENKKKVRSIPTITEKRQKNFPSIQIMVNDDFDD